MASHQAVFDQICQNLCHYNLSIDLHKSIFAREKLNYLGFKVSADGYSATDERIKAIIEYPHPKTFGSLSRFCGAVNFCHKTIKKCSRRRRRRLKGIHYRSDTNRTGAEGLSFYYPRLLHCLDQMLAVVLLSQHRVSSSKTVRPRTPCGARCIGHAVSTWSAVCSEAPHSQFGEGARPHLCMD